MTIEQQIKACCEVSGITVTELSKRLGTSQQNLSKRLKVGKFKKAELEAIAKILNCKYVSYFEFSDGTKI